MSCFFGCFGAKDNKLELDFQPHFLAKDQEAAAAAAVVTTRVCRNQLSDLFASQELEEVSCGEKSASFQSVDAQCCKEKILASDQLPDHTWTPPANASESPTSCISDPPSASRNSVSTSVKSEKAYIYDTKNDSLASQTVSASGNKRSSKQKLKKGPASSLHKDLPAQGSMSSGVRQVPNKKAGNKVNIQANRAANGRTGRSPQDRLVLGTITAQWNQEADPSRDPLKWWDGNGIPNSTNKYREDQIVSWDVTPFEERLEKALSEANSIAQRKHISGAYDTFEEETDTAASQLHSLLHSKSVVSF